MPQAENEMVNGAVDSASVSGDLAAVAASALEASNSTDNTTNMARPLLAHVAEMIVGVPLMIHPGKLSAILDGIGNRVFSPADLAALKEATAAYDQENQFSGAIQMRSSNDRKPYQITESGIAIIPVQGALTKRANWMMAMSGACTYESIGAQLAQARSDASVKAILLDINSPGGQTTGAFELGDKIYEARKDKPIWAACNDMAASAGYLIASAAENLYVTRVGMAGSIGVFSAHVDQSGLDKQLGLKYKFIFAGKYKVDGNGHEALSDTAEAHVQEEVDRQYGMFTSAVARNRKVAEKRIIDTNALCFFGEKACPLLADKVGTLEDAIVALEKKLGVGYSAVSNGPTPTAVAEIKPLESTTQTISVSGDASSAAVGAIVPLPAAPVTVAAAPEQIVAADPSDGDEDDDDDEQDEGDVNDNPDSPEKDDTQMAEDTKLPNAGTTNPVALPVEKVTGKQSLDVIEACALAGCNEKAGYYLQALNDTDNKASDGKIFNSVADVRKDLLAMRAEQSQKPGQINGHTIPGGAPTGNSFNTMVSEANALMAANPGMKKSEAVRRTLIGKPSLYVGYLEEREDATSTPRGRREYMRKIQVDYAAAGLGSNPMGNIPGAEYVG